MWDTRDNCSCDWILVKNESYKSGYAKKWIKCEACEGLTKYFQSLDNHKFIHIMNLGEITFNKKSNELWWAEFDRRIAKNKWNKNIKPVNKDIREKTIRTSLAGKLLIFTDFSLDYDYNADMDRRL